MTLEQARAKARDERHKIDAGRDPVDERRAAKRALILKQKQSITFRKAAEKLIAAKTPEWRNAKHRAQWRSTLETYAFPVIGDMPVGEITKSEILKILRPIWTTKTETASRVRSRLEAVLDWCSFHGVRTGDNPARWSGHLEHALPAPNKVAKKKHHPALPIDGAPEFFHRLNAQPGIAARALEFTILTAARSGEVYGATWQEFDLKNNVWTIPAERMKAGREHRVPLSRAARAIIDVFPRPLDGRKHVFTGASGGELSNMAMTAVLRRMQVPAVPHGFRSTFKDWAMERTDYDPTLSEMALAHTIANRAEAAYRRGDLLEKRRLLMDDWASFLTTATGSQREEHAG